MVVMLEKALSFALNAKLTGSGKTTLVLAHGYGADQSVWDKVLPELAGRYQVLAFDWSFSGSVVGDGPASHLSAAKYSSFEAFSDELVSLLDELGLSDVVYVGHSMAGMLGCIASIKRPDLFRHLMLVGASPRYLNSEDYMGGFELADVEGIFSSMKSNFQQWASHFATMVVDPHDPISVDKFTKILQKMSPEVAISLARVLFLGDNRGVLEKVEVPSAIIQCSNDAVVPPAVAEYMAEKIKGRTSLEIIDVDGHFPQLTAPKLMIGVIDKVLGYGPVMESK